MLQKWLYTLGMGGYKAALTLAAPLHPKAKKMLEGREQLLERIRLAMEKNTRPVAWFHCASLGEFEQGRPVIEAFRENYPGYTIFLTFFSENGRDKQARNAAVVELVQVIVPKFVFDKYSQARLYCF